MHTLLVAKTIIMLFLPELITTPPSKKFHAFSWLMIILGGIILFTIGFFVGRQIAPNTTLASTTLQAPTVQAQQNIQKNFQFPVDDASGKTITTIAYTVETADKQNQVIIQGQRAYAVAGKTFLILNIKLTNPSDQTVQINARNYIRISIGKNNELLAADMYSDPIIIQPISTETTKLGFPIDVHERNITLHVGELKGPKTDIAATFSQ